MGKKKGGNKKTQAPATKQGAAAAASVEDAPAVEEAAAAAVAVVEKEAVVAQPSAAAVVEESKPAAPEPTPTPAPAPAAAGGGGASGGGKKGDDKKKPKDKKKGGDDDDADAAAPAAAAPSPAGNKQQSSLPPPISTAEPAEGTVSAEVSPDPSFVMIGATSPAGAKDQPEKAAHNSNNNNHPAAEPAAAAPAATTPCDSTSGSASTTTASSPSTVVAAGAPTATTIGAGAGAEAAEASTPPKPPATPSPSRKSSSQHHFNWEEDSAVSVCRACRKEFGVFLRRHHCRRCGRIYCGDCSNKKMPVAEFSRDREPVRVCDECAAIITRETLPFPSDAPTSTRLLTAADGTKLFYQCWLPQEEPEEEEQLHDGGGSSKISVATVPPIAKASVCIVHSFGEHSGRYAHVATKLAQAGFAVHAIDLRGHGQTPGPRGSWPCIDVICSDIGLLLDEAGDEVPRFILGHSAGALLALRQRLGRASAVAPDAATTASNSTSTSTSAATTASAAAVAPVKSPPLRKVRGYILCSLAVGKSNVVSSFFSRVLSAVVPSLPLYNDIRATAAALSHVPAVETAFLNDPFINTTIVPQTACILQEALDQVTASAGTIQASLLMLHGGNDTIVDPVASQELFSTLTASADKEVRVLPHQKHEVLNETEWEETVSEIVAWITPRLDENYMPPLTPSQPAHPVSA